jgi:hypothetical protein
MRDRIGSAALMALGALQLVGGTASADEKDLRWVGTWGASPDSTGL